MSTQVTEIYVANMSGDELMFVLGNLRPAYTTWASSGYYEEELEQGAVIRILGGWNIGLINTLAMYAKVKGEDSIAVSLWQDFGEGLMHNASIVYETDEEPGFVRWERIR